MSIPCSVCTEIQKAGNIGGDQSGYRNDTAEAVRTKRNRNNRSPSMPGSSPYAVEYSTKDECSVCNRISERKKLADDIRQACESEI